MDYRRLRYFLAVAEAGHISRAAERLGIQQPPLSQQIHTLEDELGLALFTRHARGVTLTEAGRQLQVEAQAIVDAMERLKQRMAHFAAGRSGQFTVGFTSSAAAHAFTPEVLRACRDEYPDVKLQIVEHNAAELTEAIAEHRVHFGFLRVPVERPAGLNFETLLTEPVVLVLPLKHPLAQRYLPTQPVPLEALRDEGLILVRRPGAPGLYANLLQRLRERGVLVRVVAEVERMMSSINLVASGTGISIVPASMQTAHASLVVYRPLPADAGLEAPLTLVYRADSSGPGFDRFLSLVRRLASPASAAASG